VPLSKVKSTLKEKYIVIEVKNRGKKNFITTVSGLNNFSTVVVI
jgi:translation initiation factor 1 (eIF-1/SUI1)